MLRGCVSVGVLLVVVGCGGTVTDSDRTGLGTTTGEPTTVGKGPPATGSGGGQSVATGSSGGASTLVTPPAAGESSSGSAGAAGADSPEVDCLRGDVSPASPDLFVALSHERQVCDGRGSDCVEIFEARSDCSLMFQVHDEPRHATAEAADCAALARFATSSFLVAGLNDTTSCLPGSGNPMEITTTELTTGPGPRKKTSLCPEEPLVSLRACVAAVERKYFP